MRNRYKGLQLNNAGELVYENEKISRNIKKYQVNPNDDVSVSEEIVPVTIAEEGTVFLRVEKKYYNMIMQQVRDMRKRENEKNSYRESLKYNNNEVVPKKYNNWDKNYEGFKSKPVNYEYER